LGSQPPHPRALGTDQRFKKRLDLEELENFAYRQLYDGKFIEPQIRKVLACTIVLQEEIKALPRY
jgi:hypothetical protein